MIVEVAKDAKTAARNAKIKKLYGKGDLNQIEIASLMNVTQGRISQIVTNPYSDYIAVPVEAE